MTGKNKKMNFPVIKHIRITEDQAKNWDPDTIRSFLDTSEIKPKQSDTKTKEEIRKFLLENYSQEELTGFFKFILERFFEE